MTTTIGIAIVQWGVTCLVGTRPETTVLGGFDEFPGGKCEPHENAADCAIRECLEETGVAVRVERLLAQKKHTYDHGALNLNFFLCVPESQEPVPTGGFEWVPIVELGRFKFPPANVDVVESFMESFARS